MEKWNAELVSLRACRQSDHKFRNEFASIMAVGSKSPLASFLQREAEKWRGHQVVVWKCDKGEIEFSCDTLHAHFDQGGMKPHNMWGKGSHNYGLCVILHGTFRYINSSVNKDK